MRILFDTNVLYSAFSAKGLCEDVVEEATGRCAIVWSEPLQRELAGALRRKYHLGLGTQTALTAFADLCEFVVPEAPPQPVCRDPDDDVVLATAVAGKAEIIVTGDNDLLALKTYQRIRILSPRAFWAILSG